MEDTSEFTLSMLRFKSDEIKWFYQIIYLFHFDVKKSKWVLCVISFNYWIQFFIISFDDNNPINEQYKVKGRAFIFA